MKKALKAIVRSLGYEITSVPKPPRQAFFDEAPVHDYEALRTFVTGAAAFAGSPDHLQSVRKLYLTGLLRERPYAVQSRIEIGDHKTLDVGIWRRQRPGEDAAFIRRSDRRHDWFYWANNDRIEQKRRKWRVALLGELVARGYLFDPHFNPAAALRTILQSHLGSENIDVVDLAKSNQTMAELKSAIGQCLALSPDVVVIFAGNNWRTHLAEEDIPFCREHPQEAWCPRRNAPSRRKAGTCGQNSHKPGSQHPDSATGQDRMDHSGIQPGRLDRSGFRLAATRGARQSAVA